MKLPEPEALRDPNTGNGLYYTEAQMRQCWNDALDSAAEICHNEFYENKNGVAFNLANRILRLKEQVK